MTAKSPQSRPLYQYLICAQASCNCSSLVYQNTTSCSLCVCLLIYTVYYTTFLPSTDLHSLLLHVHHPYPMHIDNSCCSVACARLPTLLKQSNIQRILTTPTTYIHDIITTQTTLRAGTNNQQLLWIFNLINLEVVGPHHLKGKNLTM